MARKNRCFLPLAVLTALLVLLMAVSAAGASPAAPQGIVVQAGQTLVVDHTIKTCALTIKAGGAITAPTGYSVTLTVNGIETGQVLATTDGVDTVFAPASYVGSVVLTPAVANVVKYQPAGPPGTPTLDFPFRQALYVTDSGVVTAKSVPAALRCGRVTNGAARNIKITSRGECFNGVYVAGGAYDLDSPDISLVGNGRSDFIGYGAAVVGTGASTTLTVERAKIVTDGVARPAVVADDGANVVVKDSHIAVKDGELPADYLPTVDTAFMRSVPWMLSLSGNCRATNLLGTNTKAAYIKSYISSENWGVLSTDGCTTPTLTAIDSAVVNRGIDGYGSYGIGDATEYFLGCALDVKSYATISRGSYLYYGDSTRAKVAALNRDLGLGLTGRELRDIPVRPTIVKSDRFGIMWHGGGTLDVSGGTVFDTRETTFLDKGQAIAMTVDGSQGAKLLPDNGVLMQVMDDDDPGPVMPGMMNTGVYHEPTGAPAVDATHDVTTADATDALATFANIRVAGDFYNSTRGGFVQGPFGPPSSVSKNLAVTLEHARVKGVISASTAVHPIDTITAAEYRLLGEVTNTPAAPINNGVIVTLDPSSRWVVTGTSYLTHLTIADGAVVKAPRGHTVTMTIDGLDEPIVAGDYTGAIVLTVH
jgi:hypothetical protein